MYNTHFELYLNGFRSNSDYSPSGKILGGYILFFNTAFFDATCRVYNVLLI